MASFRCRCDHRSSWWLSAARDTPSRRPSPPTIGLPSGSTTRPFTVFRRGAAGSSAGLRCVSPAPSASRLSAHPRGPRGFRCRHPAARPAASRPGPPAASTAMARRPARVESVRDESRIRVIRRPSSDRSEIIPTPDGASGGKVRSASSSRWPAYRAPVGTEFDHVIVADFLGRLLDPLRQQPDQGLDPEQGGGRSPQEVPQAIPPRQVGQLVDERLAQVLLGILRQQDRRPAQAVQAGAAEERGPQHRRAESAASARRGS